HRSARGFAFALDRTRVSRERASSFEDAFLLLETIRECFRVETPAGRVLSATSIAAAGGDAASRVSTDVSVRKCLGFFACGHRFRTTAFGDSRKGCRLLSAQICRQLRAQQPESCGDGRGPG